MFGLPVIMMLETLPTPSLVTIFLLFLELEKDGASPLLVEVEVKKVLRQERLRSLGILLCVWWFRKGRDIVMLVFLKYRILITVPSK